MSNTTGPINFSITNLPEDSRGQFIINLNLALIVISTVLMSTRLYVRGFMIKGLGVDDLIATISYVCTAALHPWYHGWMLTLLGTSRRSLLLRDLNRWLWVRHTHERSASGENTYLLLCQYLQLSLNWHALLTHIYSIWQQCNSCSSWRRAWSDYLLPSSTHV